MINYLILSRSKSGKFSCLRGTDLFIIQAAHAECHKAGTTLKSISGFTGKPWTKADQLQASIEKLSDDGRLFETFLDTPQGRAAFLLAASNYGPTVLLQARALTGVDPS